MQKKKFVLSGYFGFKNFGDEAILSVLVKKLQQQNHNITVITSDTEDTSKKFSKINCIYTFNLSRIIKEISQTDYLISGGGSLLQDVTSFKSLLYYLAIIFLGLLFRKKVIIFAQGIGPIRNPFGRFLTSFLLRFCTYVSVRDSKSHKFLKDFGINADLLCDPIFSTKIPQIQKDEIVAIQLRDFKTMNEDFIDRLASEVVKNFSDKKIEIYSFQNSIDLEICKRFQKAINLLNSDIKTTLYSYLTEEEIITNISKAKYLVAMRFHAIIIGLLAKVKTIAINYDIKVEKIADEFNLPTLDLKKAFKSQFHDIKNINLEEIDKKVSLKTFDWSNFDKVINS